FRHSLTRENVAHYQFSHHHPHHDRHHLSVVKFSNSSTLSLSLSREDERDRERVRIEKLVKLATGGLLGTPDHSNRFIITDGYHRATLFSWRVITLLSVHLSTSAHARRFGAIQCNYLISHTIIERRANKNKAIDEEMMNRTTVTTT